MIRCLIAAALLALFAASGGWAGEDAAEPKLQNNPFVRPEVEKPKPPARKKSPPAEGKAAVAPKPAPEPPWKPELRGTLVAGPRSLADVGGVILRIGDEWEGYLLREVRHAEVVFQREERWVLVRLGGETVVLPAPPPDGSDEGPGSALERDPGAAPQAARTPVEQKPELRETAAPVARASQPREEPAPPPATVAVGSNGAGMAEPAPAPAGPAAHGLQVGLYRSQRYLLEQEGKLSAIGVPHARLPSKGRGTGYRVTIPVPEGEPATLAREILAACHYSFDETQQGLDVHLYLESEAERIAGLLEEAGIPSQVLPTRGEQPRWTLLAGPFNRTQAQRVRDRLSGQGMDCFLRHWPAAAGLTQPTGAERRQLAARSPANVVPSSTPASGARQAVTSTPVPDTTPKVPADLGLQVGLYRSQRYLVEQEGKLSALGVPHARVQSSGKGPGYLVTIRVPDGESLTAARNALAAQGYTFEMTELELAVHLYLESEVERITGLLAAAGIPSSAEPTHGKQPRWTLLAGPFTRDQAKRERNRLSARGVDCYVRNWPSEAVQDRPTGDYEQQLVAHSPSGAARKVGPQ